MTLLMLIAQMLFVPVASPLLIGVVRNIKARCQQRVGASVFQPYRDLYKLFHKDEVISEDASWVFRSAPFLVFSVTLAMAAIVPIVPVSHSAPFADIVFVVYALALGTFFLALAGMDAGSAFGGFGSSREMTVAALTEGGLIFALLAVALMAGTSDLSVIMFFISHAPLSALLPISLAFAAFVIALLAETARFPFDNPATHLELTMIHEAMILEYSGPRLALMEWAAANKFLIFLTLAANLFLPSIIATAYIGTILAALTVYAGKIAALALFVALLESSIAKLRFFRLPDLLFTAFVLAAVAIFLV